MLVSSLALASLLSGANALLPLVAEGNKFYQLQEDYTKPAESITIYGVDYQPGGSSKFSLSAGSDVLTDAAACQRDAYLLNKLGANAIRVYSVSPWLNHDECMTIFNNAGIYVLLDVNTPDNSLNRADPASSYNRWYLNNVFGLVDAFKEYPNLLGFLAGNEVINDGASAKKDPTYIRAVIRDLKQYIYEWSNRTIPVGYAAADVLEYRTVSWEYFQCNANTGDELTDVFSRADFFGINSYEWCSGVNDYQSSGYGDIKSTFGNSSIPIVFTEYGCNTKQPRSFDEVDQGIYGPLKDVISGAFVYEYSNEVSNYGLVDIDSDGNVEMRKDYDNLQSAFSKVSIAPTSTQVTNLPTGTAALSGVPACSSQFSSNGFDWNFSLPTCPGKDLIKKNGGNRNIGSLGSYSTVSENYTIKNKDGDQITPAYSYNSKFGVNTQSNVPSSLLNQNVRGLEANDSNSSSPKTSSSAKSTSSSSTSASSSATSSATSSAASSKKDGKNSAPATNKLGLPVAMSFVATVFITCLM